MFRRDTLTDTINELSADLVKRYRDDATTTIGHHRKAINRGSRLGGWRKREIDKRERGLDKARRRLGEDDLKELSQALVGRYADAAQKQRTDFKKKHRIDPDSDPISKHVHRNPGSSQSDVYRGATGREGSVKRYTKSHYPFFAKIRTRKNKGIIHDHSRKRNVLGQAKKSSLHPSKDLKKFYRRGSGLEKAQQRLAAEYDPELNELSKKTLANYVGKAVDDHGTRSMQAVVSHPKTLDAINRKRYSRYKGIKRAVKKLAGEGVELSEFSRHALQKTYPSRVPDGQDPEMERHLHRRIMRRRGGW